MHQLFIDYHLLKSFSLETFTSRAPFPWHNFDALLTRDGFQALHQDFPSLELFEKHSGVQRQYEQRPHDRYYLGYKTSIFHQAGDEKKGVVQAKELPKTWQIFLEELETSTKYRNFIKSVLAVSDYKARYTFHIGVTNSEVSPHVDAPSSKIGTHIFYFNTDEDWAPTWGESTLVLGDKRTVAMNPEFTDFGTVIPIQITNNRSFLFKNTPDAWHGVKPLTCPEGRYRCLFNVLFDSAEEAEPLVPRIAARSLSQKFHPRFTRFFVR